MFTNVTLLYFLLLVPLSGFIAWAGDRIGHRSGKRRHSLFGLRPRHTAMVFTVGAGACISLLSFGMVWALSESFRVVVRDGASLVEKNHVLKEDNAHLLLRNGSLRHEADGLTRTAAASAAEAVNADLVRDRAVKRAHEASERARKAQAEVQKAEARLAQETRALTEAQDLLREDNVRLARLEKELGAKASELQAARKKVAEAVGQLADAKLRAADANERAGIASRNLQHVQKAAQEALEVQRKNLEENLTDLKHSLAEETKLFDDKTRQIDELRKEQERLDLQVKEGQSEFAKIQENIRALRGRQITYQVGEEVDRIAIKPGYNIWRIETILGAFLNTAGQRAQARGAGRAKDGFQRAVVILPKRLPPDAPGEEPHYATEDDSVHAAATAIRTANTDVVVLAGATANAVAGEPVPVEFHIFRNPVVIPAETRLGEVAINGNGSRQEIADALKAFLSQKVRRSLLQAGIIPQARGGEPTDVAPPTPAGTPSVAQMGIHSARISSSETEENGSELITLTGDEWLQIMDHVREAGFRARVVAVAARDMRAGDSVSLRFEVKGLFGGAQSAVLSGDARRPYGSGSNN